MNFTEAARLKRFIKKNFSVNLHIHDTCGGLYVSIDEPDEAVKEFILAYCRANGISVSVSSDGRSFFPTAKDPLDDSRPDNPLDQHFEYVKDLDVVYVAAAKRAVHLRRTAVVLREKKVRRIRLPERTAHPPEKKVLPAPEE